jgi:hypothetical protein
MHYKTVVLELLQDQYPALHERLRTRRLLLQSLDEYAIELKARHDYWTTEFRQANPDRSAMQIASVAMEMAIEDLQERLSCDSPPSPNEAGACSLEAAIASIRHPLPATASFHSTRRPARSRPWRRRLPRPSLPLRRPRPGQRPAR